jgi:molecular chaperone GrpE (heat shock protein)
MAPRATRSQPDHPEQGVPTPSSEVLTTQSAETMSATQLTEAQQLAAAREQIRQLQEQLQDIHTASQRSTPSFEGLSNSATIKLKDLEPLIDGADPTFES